MPAYDVIKQAILAKRNISATYQGHPREMSPHAIGLKNGHQNALFYQFGGTSKSGLQPVGSPKNWRCLPIDELENVTSIGGQWHTGPNHSQAQTCIDVIDAEVTY